jgi:hypothetical protein
MNINEPIVQINAWVFSKTRQNQMVIRIKETVYETFHTKFSSPYFLAWCCTTFFRLSSPKTSIFLLVQEYNGASRPKLRRFDHNVLYAFKSLVEII